MFDTSLTASVLCRWPLCYTAGPDDALDRPAHVRAGSGLTWFGVRLAVIQDDAHFVALIDPYQRTVESIALPAGYGGQRQFDDLRGTKAWKLDLEACTTVDEEGQPFLVAMGSGSTSRREQILIIPCPSLDPRKIRLFHAPAFYELLRSQARFAGSQLNVEGAVYLGGDVLRLFQRGNGAVCNGRLPVNATCDIAWSALRTCLNDPTASPPAPQNIIQHDLGSLNGVNLSFTDATVRGGCVFFSATAEASPDAVCDGPVAGSVIGRFDASGVPRWTLLLDERGNRLCAKVEGILLDAAGENRGWIVIDQDDPSTPSEMCEIELKGPW